MKVLIDFEDPPCSHYASVTTQYQKKGVILDGGIVSDQDDGAVPHSGLQYVMYFTAEFQQGPTTAMFRFPKGQKRIKLWAGSLQDYSAASYGWLVAYDAFGNQIAADGPHKLTSGACSVPFEVTTTPNVITKVAINGYGGVDNRGFPLFPVLVLDDLEFEADPELTVSLGAVEPILVVGTSDAGLVVKPVGGGEPPGGPFGRGVRNVIVGLLATDEVSRRKCDASASLGIRRAAIQNAISELEHIMSDLDDESRTRKRRSARQRASGNRRPGLSGRRTK
jgi:hypothetical protein